MAKAQKEQPVEPTSFPITLDEFLDGVPKALTETRAGFNKLCKSEGIAGNRMKEEWQKLFDLFATKPIKTTWAEWQKTGGK